MRSLPLAGLILAIASLVPSTLSAHNHPSKLAVPVRHTSARDLHPPHVQHPQPATFRGSDRRHRVMSPASHGSRGSAYDSSANAVQPRRSATALRASGGSRRSEKAGSRLHKLGSDKYNPRHSRHSTRHDLLALTDTHLQRSRSRSRRSVGLRNFPPSDSSTGTLTPVVNIIRSTSDRPQLPSIQQAITQSTLLPMLYSEQGRLIVPAALVGSREILIRQNVLADQDGLGRVQDDADLEGMRAHGMLVALPVSEELRVDERLPSNRRFCRAWTAQFLATIARAHYARFHTPLQINSAVRTVAFQLRLQRTNGNAAPAEGDTASPHLTGQAIDIAKRGLSLAEIAWLRGYLLPLIQAGRVDVEEEFQQSCFHISVYRRYLPPDSTPQRYPVTSRSTSVLAAVTPDLPR